jgi:hypothetical protein
VDSKYSNNNKNNSIKPRNIRKFNYYYYYYY